MPIYFARGRLSSPRYIIDVTPPGRQLTAGTVMAVGGRVVLHIKRDSLRHQGRAAIVPGLCRVWAMANRIDEDCAEFASFFDLYSPRLFAEPGGMAGGAFLDITVAGSEGAPLSCFLRLNEQHGLFAASDGLAVRSYGIPEGVNHFEARCHRTVGQEVETTHYRGMVEVQRAGHLHVELDWQGLRTAAPGLH